MTVAESRPTYDHLVEEAGRKRIVQRTATTCGRLYKSRQLPTHLMIAFDEVAKAAAEALGAATEDRQASTACLISRYDGMPIDGTQFGSRSPPVKQLDGQRQVNWIRGRLPPEFVSLFDGLLKEEAGVQSGKALSLTELGQHRGYQSVKQASASGGTQVYDLLVIVAHLRREYLERERGGRVHPNREREWPAELR